MSSSSLTPYNIAAVQSGGRSYVFYVNSKHQLSYIVAPEGNEIPAQSNEPPKEQLVTIDKQPVWVRPGSRQIAAVAYNFEGVEKIHVIYTRQGDGNMGYLSETYREAGIGKAPDPQWQQGTLGYDNPKHWVGELTSLTATIRGGSNRPAIWLFALDKNQQTSPKIDTHYWCYEKDAWLSQTGYTGKGN